LCDTNHIGLSTRVTDTHIFPYLTRVMILQYNQQIQRYKSLAFHKYKQCKYKQMRNKKDSLLTIRLSSDELEEIKKRAKQMKCSMSELIRITNTTTPDTK